MRLNVCFIIWFHYQFRQSWPVNTVDLKDLSSCNAVQSTALCVCSVSIMEVSCPGRLVETGRYNFLVSCWLTDWCFVPNVPRSAFAHSTLKYGLNSYKQQNQMKSLLRRTNVIWQEELQFTVNVLMIIWDGCIWSLCVYATSHISGELKRNTFDINIYCWQFGYLEILDCLFCFDVWYKLMFFSLKRPF